MFMSTAARTAATRSNSCIGINPDLQPLGMDIIDKRLNARRKLLRIGEYVSAAVAAHLPAVVYDHVLVPGIFHPTAHYCVRHRLDEILADIASKPVPTTPTHRRSGGQFQPCSRGRKNR